MNLLFRNFKRLQIVWDVDDILFPTTEQYIKFCEEVYGLKLKLEDFTGCLHPRQISSFEEAKRRTLEFTTHQTFLDLDIAPVPGTLELIDYLTKEGLEHASVTSRMEKDRQHTIRWLVQHFHLAFGDRIKFSQSHYSNEGRKETKADLCKRLGARFIVEDHPIYAEECAIKAPDTVVFLYHRPWNYFSPWQERLQGHISRERIHRFHSFEDSELCLGS